MAKKVGECGVQTDDVCGSLERCMVTMLEDARHSWEGCGEYYWFCLNMRRTYAATSGRLTPSTLDEIREGKAPR